MYSSFRALLALFHKKDEAFRTSGLKVFEKALAFSRCRRVGPHVPF